MMSYIGAGFFSHYTSRARRSSAEAIVAAAKSAVPVVVDVDHSLYTLDYPLLACGENCGDGID